MKPSVIIASVLLLSGCTENYSNGDRVGVITQFSNTGVFWKSHEGHLNATQTGMNSSVPFDFSIDSNNEPPGVVATLDSAALHGWKVKLTYHETMGKNWFNHRGHTSHFVTKVEVLDKNFATAAVARIAPESVVHDTIYVVIDRTR